MTTEERLEMLEKGVKEIRLHSRGTSILLCLSLLFIAVGWLRESLESLFQASKSLQVSSITCQYLNVTDKQGNSRVTINSDAGATWLMFRGHNSDANASLSMDKDGNSSLSLHNGDANVILGLGYQGAALKLVHSGKDLQTAASLSADQHGGVGLGLLTFGKGISTNAWLADSKDGSAEMGMMNAQGQARAPLGAAKGEGPAMVIRDETGKTKWSTP